MTMLKKHSPEDYAEIGLLLLLRELGLKPNEISKLFTLEIEKLLKNSNKKSAKRELNNLQKFEKQFNDRVCKRWAVVERFSKKKAYRDFSVLSLSRVSKEPIPKIWETLKDSIVESYKKNSSILISFSQIDNSILKHLTSHPELVHCIEWRTFEYLIATILESFEYEIELTRPSKDGGVDIIAIKNADTFGEHKYLIQAKKSKRVIKVEPVRELLFLGDYYKATKSCLVTTSKFSRGAWELANIYKWKLELIDFNTLRNWIVQASNLEQA